MHQLSTSVLQTPLAELVRNDPRITPVLERFGLDYCCHGHQTLQEASIDRQIPVSEVVEELLALGPRVEGHAAEASWPDLSALVRHIVTRHHRYVREHQPILQGWLDKLVMRHGARHPELKEVQSVFRALADGLIQHMNKEENILFPYIENLCARNVPGAPRAVSPFVSIQSPIRAMEQEHLEAGNLLARLRALTSGYEPPSDACTTYRVCYEGLARFEADLHQHVHLENYVLFPRTVALETSM